VIYARAASNTGRCFEHSTNNQGEHWRYNRPSRIAFRWYVRNSALLLPHDANVGRYKEGKTAFEMITQTENRFVRTLCEDIDQMLGAGVPVGQLTEFCMLLIFSSYTCSCLRNSLQWRPQQVESLGSARHR